MDYRTQPRSVQNDGKGISDAHSETLGVQLLVHDELSSARNTNESGLDQAWLEIPILRSRPAATQRTQMGLCNGNIVDGRNSTAQGANSVLSDSQSERSDVHTGNIQQGGRDGTRIHDQESGGIDQGSRLTLETINYPEKSIFR